MTHAMKIYEKMFKIGKVINYYEKIGITIVKLSAPLSVGDKIKFYKDGGVNFISTN